ncbi:hypothetical protein J4711_14220 [Staphylococcus epidermidis]|nr:hypothetical protein [Staphylococcus epidermidis]
MVAYAQASWRWARTFNAAVPSSGDELLKAGGNIKPPEHRGAATFAPKTCARLGADVYRRCGTLKGNGQIDREVDVQSFARRRACARAASRKCKACWMGHGIACNDHIECGNHIQAGWGIKALGDIRAACSLRGRDLAGRRRIAAGSGYGVFAGMNVQMEAWPDCAWVRALKKPQSLISGWWENAALTPERCAHLLGVSENIPHKHTRHDILATQAK